MYAAKQVFGAAQRRAFSVSAKQVSGPMYKSIRPVLPNSDSITVN